MLSRLKVTNYRSIKELNLDLPEAEDGTRLTVLIGPNASGKSGILDAPVFVRDLVVASGNAWEVHRRGATKKAGVLDFAALAWKGRRSAGPMTFSLEFVRGGGAGRVEAIYGCAVDATPAVVKESVIERDVDGRLVTLLESDAKAGGRAVDGTGAFIPLGYVPMHPALARCNLAEQFPRVASVWQEVAEIRKYVLMPGFMRDEEVIQTARPLDVYGQSLSGVLFTLKNDSLPAFNEVVGYLRHHVPEIDDLVTPLLEGQRTRVAVRERHLASPVSSTLASDGVLSLLALATIALQPFPASCVLIEEPELHLHQGLMPLVADLLRMLARRTTVLATTHSPSLVGHLDPRDVAVVKKVEGGTTVDRLDPAAPSIRDALEVMNLGEAWMNGFFGGLPSFGGGGGTSA
jgi:predicted ATPase